MTEQSKHTRTYKVLVLANAEGEDPPHPDGWDFVADVEASSGEQAIRLTASEKGVGRYAAVPHRSWTEITVRVETPAPRIFLDKDGATDVPPEQPTLPIA